ncbi:MAG: sulfate permease [Acidobacteriota bacterium]|nr:sulfate permease [Acidobacteriota bacterium]
MSFVPGLDVLRHYDRNWLSGDVLAGITVAAYMIPQTMAYAEVAGLPAVVGLWALVGPLLVYAIFGSSRQLSVGPESTVALMTALAISSLAGVPAVGDADLATRATLGAVLALTTGVICLVAYGARLGFLAGLLSRPVLIGYLAGAAVLMMISQLGKVTGLQVSGERVWDEVGSLLAQLDQVHLPTFVLASVSVVALFVTKRFAPKWPGPLLVMLLAAAVVQIAGLETQGVKVVGAVPSGLPRVVVPDFIGVDWAKLLPAALGIAVVSFSDNALIGRAFAARRREQIDTNQELLALGLSNISAGLSQGFPVSSSGSRTVLGDSMGSRTQLHSLVALGCLLTTMLVLGPVLAAFPDAALGGVVVYAAIRMVDIAGFRRLARFRLAELVLALATMIAVVLFNVLIGIAIALGLSLLDLLRRIANPAAAVLGYVPGLAGMHDITDFQHVEQVPGLVVFRYDSPLFFANAENFRRRALAAVDGAPGEVHWFLLNVEANTQLDLTAIDALEEVRDSLAARGVIVALARVKQDTRAELERAEFIERLHGRVYPTLPTAVGAYVDWVQQTTGEYPTWAAGLPLPRNNNSG